MWVLWIMLMVAAAGYFIYRVDKNIKAKFEDKFNPHEWDLPRSVEVVVDPKPQPIAAPAANTKLSYSSTPSALNELHLPIYKALQQAIADDYFLLTNINATDVLHINPNGNLLAMQVAKKNLSSKQFDFLVCDKQHLRALCAITLAERLDPALEQACEDAQLPLARFKVQPVYNVAVIRASILNALGIQAVEVSTESALDISDSSERQTVSEKTCKVDNGISVEQCPECSAVMLKRKAKTGPSAGKLFWICSRYPKCRGVIAIK